MALQEKIAYDFKTSFVTADRELGHGDSFASDWGDTPNDIVDMRRLGKKQEFKRNFGLWSALGFVSIYMATWEYVLVSLGAGLINGGFGGLFWVFIGTVICYASIVASLAEMESMAPTSGGQYHWVSEFAPEQHQKILSYASGWMSTLGWVASTSSSVFVVATLLEVMIDVSMDQFSFTNWQFTLVMLASLAVTIVFNTWGAKILPLLETVSLIWHILGLFVTIIPLWVLAKKSPATEVFTHVVNLGGWPNVGTACIISQVSVLYCNLGSDSVVHISEEVEDAGLVVPQCMWWSYVINVVMGIIMLITMLFCIGDLQAAVNSDAPYANLFKNTGSQGVEYFLLILLFILIFSGNVTCLLTASREMWAFARDKGLPGSRFIAHMNTKYNIPFNSVYVTSIIAGILCLINLGSNLGFNIIVSLTLLALLSTYMISIGCVLHLRLMNKPLPPARWSLGRWGLPINAFAVVYSAFVIVLSCFPTSYPVTSPDDANWAPAVWVGVILIALVVYLVHGKRVYTPPVMYVEGRREEGVEFQST